MAIRDMCNEVWDEMKVGDSVSLDVMRQLTHVGGPKNRKEDSLIRSWLSDAARKGWMRKEGERPNTRYVKIVESTADAVATPRPPGVRDRKRGRDRGITATPLQVGEGVLAVVEKLKAQIRRERDLHATEMGAMRLQLKEISGDLKIALKRAREDQETLETFKLRYCGDPVTVEVEKLAEL